MACCAVSSHGGRIGGKKGKGIVAVPVFDKVKIDPAKKMAVGGIVVDKFGNTTGIVFNRPGKNRFEMPPETDKHISGYIFSANHCRHGLEQAHQLVIHRLNDNLFPQTFKIRGQP